MRKQPGLLSSYYRRLLVTAGIVFCSAFCATAPAAQNDAKGLGQPDVWVSGNGLYRLRFSSELNPIRINRLHSWTLELNTADGRPVAGAQFSVTGGMPIHDHGLPTEPRVTREIDSGKYLLEGVRFHMNGAWELVISIVAADGSDTVVIGLTV